MKNQPNKACFLAHSMYLSCCFNKLTAAGSTAWPAAFRGPELPLVPVKPGPLFPLWVTFVPSFLIAPVGQFLEQ